MIFKSIYCHKDTNQIKLNINHSSDFLNVLSNTPKSMNMMYQQLYQKTQSNSFMIAFKFIVRLLKQIKIIYGQQIFIKLNNPHFHKLINQFYQINIIPEIMRRVVERFFEEFDMFAAAPTLRSRGEPQISRPCAGVVSFLLAILFAYIFFKGLSEIIRMDSSRMQFSQVFKKDFQSNQVNNIMLGVRFWIDGEGYGLRNVSQFQQYFSMVSYILVGDQIKEFKLQPCRPEQWKMLGEEYQKYFYIYKLNSSYCLPEIVNSTIKGPDDTFMSVNFKRCTDGDNITNCKSQEQINSYINKSIQDIANFPVWVFFLNQVVQQEEQNPLKYYVETKRFTVTKLTGQLAFQSFQRFTIATDYSFWPIIEQTQEIEGYVVSQITRVNFYFGKNVQQNNLVVVYGYFNQNRNIYNRTMQKVDDWLSYAGGLFALIISFLAFFVASYNEYRYQLMVAQSSFNYDSDGHKVKQRQFNFLVYIKYSIFDWINTLFCHQMSWKDCQQIDETRQQANNLLDVEKLFRRLEYLQKMVLKNADPNFSMCMSLIQPESLEQIKKKRLVLEYYQQIIKLQPAATVQDALNQNSLSFQYVKIVQKKISKLTKSLKNSKKQLKRSQSLQSNNRLQLEQNEKQSTQEELNQQLTKYLKLQNCPQICRCVSKHTTILKQAKLVSLDQQMSEVEERVTQAFLALKPEAKADLILKMPIKIVFRLMLKAQQMGRKTNKEQKQNMDRNGKQNQLGELIGRSSSIIDPINENQNQNGQ